MINYHLFDCFDPVLNMEVGIIRNYVEHYNHSLKIQETSMYHDDKISMLHFLYLISESLLFKLSFGYYLFFGIFLP